MDYALFLVLAFLFASLFTPLVIKFANRFKFLDIPRPPRNLHSKPVAKLGGIAIFLWCSHFCSCNYLRSAVLVDRWNQCRNYSSKIYYRSFIWRIDFNDWRHYRRQI